MPANLFGRGTNAIRKNRNSRQAVVLQEMVKCQKTPVIKKVKARAKVFPSARASQRIAKCRKSKGQVRKTKAGSSLKRWGAEKWKDTRTGKPCGQGKANEYCRPTRRVSSKTPVTKSEMTKSQLKRKRLRKARSAWAGGSNP